MLPQPLPKKGNAIKDEKSKYYKLAIKANPNKVINPILQTTLSFSINDVDEAGMYKFKKYKHQYLVYLQSDIVILFCILRR